jgi:signal transduction histidine kinase
VHACLDAAVQSCWWPDNIRLIKRYSENLPLAKANMGRLETVFHNLLSNAIQAMAQTGGEIQIVTGQTKEGEIEISLIDNGPGIPPELQPHVFDPGVSGKDGGLGIGLWLVETFVHQFGGQIECTSTMGKGTAFNVSLQPAVTTMDGLT